MSYLRSKSYFEHFAPFKELTFRLVEGVKNDNQNIFDKLASIRDEDVKKGYEYEDGMNIRAQANKAWEEEKYKKYIKIINRLQEPLTATEIKRSHVASSRSKT